MMRGPVNYLLMNVKWDNYDPGMLFVLNNDARMVYDGNMIDTAKTSQPIPIVRRRSRVQRLLLGVVLVWLGVAGGALWLHYNPPVTDLIMTPLPGWQLQVWFGTRTLIAQSAEERGAPVVPIVLVFYETPFTGIRLLARSTLPVWPLAVSAASLAGLALLMIWRPAFARQHA
jgi:hypothetical protein